MARKPANTKETSSEVQAAEPVARAAKPRTTAAKTPRVTAARHVQAPAEAVPEPQIIDSAENPQEAIARIAYGFWEARGNQGGNALEDWVRAENEYRQVLAAQ